MKKQLISHRLFKMYAIWFVICTLLILLISIWYVVNEIYDDVLDTQLQMQESINRNIETYFASMDELSRELTISESFKRLALKEIPATYDAGKSNSANLSAMMKEANKMIEHGFSLGVITSDNHYIWIGEYPAIGKLTNVDSNTYEEYSFDGSAYIRVLHENQYLENIVGTAYSPSGLESVLTLSRSIGNKTFYFNGDAILEIQVPMQDFQKEMAAFIQDDNNDGMQVSLYDKEGNLILGNNDLDLMSCFVNSENPVGNYRKGGYYINIKPVLGDTVYAAYTVSVKSYYEKVVWFLLIAAIFSIMVIFTILIITYRISKQLSKPMHQICENVKKIDLENGIQYEFIDSDIQEIHFLSHAVKKMSLELDESLNKIIMLKDFELHSKLLALQAQMQPHFLYNTLATIRSIADSEGNVEISRICVNLTKMFRYIASDESEGVCLYEEIQHVEHYVDIMKERFPSAEITIDVPLEMMRIRIPKLTVQPLVENSFKYCNRNNPVIVIRGKINADGSWSISVLDNGEGFSEEKRKEILEKCKRSLDGVQSLSNKIDGMGFANVYVRLKLFYKEKTQFIIDKCESCITIGVVSDAKEKLY